MALFKETGGERGFDGTIDSVTFEVKTWDNGDPSLTAVVAITPDGAEQGYSKFLRAGTIYEDSGITVNADGTLTIEEGKGLWGGSEFATLVKSALANGREEADFADVADFRPLAGYRYRFANQVNAERQAAKGSRKGSDGKSYPQTDFVILKTYGPVEAKKKGGEGRSGAKTTTVSAKKAAPAPSTDIDDSRIDTVLAELVASYGKEGSLNRVAVDGAMVRYAIKKKLSEQERDELRALLSDEAVLQAAEERGTITYDAKKGDVKKPGVISLAA